MFQIKQENVEEDKNYYTGVNSLLVESLNQGLYLDTVNNQSYPTTSHLKALPPPNQISSPNDIFEDGKPYPTLSIIDENIPYSLNSPIQFYETPYEGSTNNDQKLVEMYSENNSQQNGEESIATKIVILNSDGTLSEEFMLPDGFNLESIQEIVDNRDIITNAGGAVQPAEASISSIQHPIPKKELVVSEATFRNNQMPRNVIDTALSELRLLENQANTPTIKTEPGRHENSHPVFLQQKENFLINELQSKIMFEATDNPFPSSHYAPIDYSLPTNPYPDQTESGRHSDLKMHSLKSYPSESSPYTPHRKTKSLGALGKALHGTPSNPTNPAMQICPLCKFQATTKNPYRHLQDHLARVHFKDRLARELPAVKPFTCPVPVCQGKQYTDWQAVMRHYIGNKHGILEKYVREALEQRGEAD